MNKKHKKLLKEEIKMKKCRYCLSIENLTLDHKQPVSRGGTDDRKNLQVLCRRCNEIKGSFSHGEIQKLFSWFREIEKKREDLGSKPLFNRGKSLS